MSKRFGRKLQNPENKIDADINYEEAEKSKENFLFKKISNEGMPITRFQQRAINEGRSIHTFLLSVLKK